MCAQHVNWQYALRLSLSHRPGQAVYRETLIFWTVSADQLDGGEMSGQDMNSSPWVYQTSFTVHKTLEMKARGHDLTSNAVQILLFHVPAVK